jgi:hypothetical protein
MGQGELGEGATILGFSRKRICVENNSNTRGGNYSRIFWWTTLSGREPDPAVTFFPPLSAALLYPPFIRHKRCTGLRHALVHGDCHGRCWKASQSGSPGRQLVRRRAPVCYGSEKRTASRAARTHSGDRIRGRDRREGVSGDWSRVAALDCGQTQLAEWAKGTTIPTEAGVGIAQQSGDDSDRASGVEIQRLGRPGVSQACAARVR